MSAQPRTAPPQASDAPFRTWSDEGAAAFSSVRRSVPDQDKAPLLPAGWADQLERMSDRIALLDFSLEDLLGRASLGQGQIAPDTSPASDEGTAELMHSLIEALERTNRRHVETTYAVNARIAQLNDKLESQTNMILAALSDAVAGSEQPKPDTEAVEMRLDRVESLLGTLANQSAPHAETDARLDRIEARLSDLQERAASPEDVATALSRMPSGEDAINARIDGLVDWLSANASEEANLAERVEAALQATEMRLARSPINMDLTQQNELLDRIALGLAEIGQRAEADAALWNECLCEILRQIEANGWRPDSNPEDDSGALTDTLVA